MGSLSLEDVLSRAAREDPRMTKLAARLRAVEHRPLDAVELRVATLYETRTLAFRTRPAAVTVDLPDDPNPWEAELHFPEDAGRGAFVERAYEGEYARVCAMCSGVGDAECRVCRGRGSLSDDDGSRTCGKCQGTGREACGTCEKSGVVLAQATAVANLEEHLGVHKLFLDESVSLPDDVFLALQDELRGVRPLASVGDARLGEEALATLAAALEAAEVTSSGRIVQAVGRLAADLGLGAVRIRSQRALVGRVPLFVIDLPGQQAFVLDEPPRIIPEDALGGGRGRLVLVAALVLVLVAVATAFFAR